MEYELLTYQPMNLLKNLKKSIFKTIKNQRVTKNFRDISITSGNPIPDSRSFPIPVPSRFPINDPDPAPNLTLL
jgi:hypothetical protein